MMQVLLLMVNPVGNVGEAEHEVIGPPVEVGVAVIGTPAVPVTEEGENEITGGSCGVALTSAELVLVLTALVALMT